MQIFPLEPYLCYLDIRISETGKNSGTKADLIPKPCREVDGKGKWSFLEI